MKIRHCSGIVVAFGLISACSTDGAPSVVPESGVASTDFCEVTPSAPEAETELNARLEAYHDWAEEIGLEDLEASGRAVKPLALSSGAPSYPPRAMACGYTGQCTLIYDVDARGVPKNILAVCSATTFEYSARQVIARSTFRPFTIDGEPQEYKSLRQVITFKLDDTD